MQICLPIQMIPRSTLLTFFLSCSLCLVAQPKEGTFTLGLISFNVTNSLMQENLLFDSFKEQIKASSEHEVSFTPQSSMTVIRSGETTNRVIYNKESNVLILILETEKEKLYSVDSFDNFLSRELSMEMKQEMDSVMQTQTFKDSINKLIHVSRNPEDQKLIFGIPCTKVTMMNPDSLDKIFSISYCTDLIPGAEIMGPLKDIMMPGVALETTMFIEGFTFTIGAIAFTPASFKNANFGINLKKYKKVSSQEMKDLGYHFGN